MWEQFLLASDVLIFVFLVLILFHHIHALNNFVLEFLARYLTDLCGAFSKLSRTHSNNLKPLHLTYNVMKNLYLT
jgi:hypothetical protein